jgi:hypothetical protein
MASSLFVPAGAMALMTAARTISTFCPTASCNPRARAASVKPRAATSDTKLPIRAVAARPAAAVEVAFLAPPFAETYLRPARRKRLILPPFFAALLIARRARVHALPARWGIIGEFVGCGGGAAGGTGSVLGDAGCADGSVLSAEPGAGAAGAAGGPAGAPCCAHEGNRGVLSLGPELLADVPINQFAVLKDDRVVLAALASGAFTVLFDQVASISLKARSASGCPLHAF